MFDALKQSLARRSPISLELPLEFADLAKRCAAGARLVARRGRQRAAKILQLDQIDVAVAHGAESAPKMSGFLLPFFYRGRRGLICIVPLAAMQTEPVFGLRLKTQRCHAQRMNSLPRRLLLAFTEQAPPAFQIAWPSRVCAPHVFGTCLRAA